MVKEIFVLSDKNETRGPMLEGWLKYYGKDKVRVISAGLSPGKLNLVAAKAMMEAVIDIVRHKSQIVDEVDTHKFDYVITLTDAAMEYAAKKFSDATLIHKSVADPLYSEDEDLEKLRKRRVTANELEEFAIGFIHKNVKNII